MDWKYVKKNINKDIIYGIAIVILCIAFVFCLFHFAKLNYRKQFGRYTILPNYIPQTSVPITDIYENNGKFLFVGTNCIYGRCSWKLGEANSKIIYPKNPIIQKEIGEFEKSFQLKNGNLLFYKLHPQNKGDCARLNFIFYNIDKNSIIKSIQNTVPIEVKISKTGEILPKDLYKVYILDSKDFLVEIKKTGYSNIYEKYDSNKKQFVILNDNKEVDKSLKQYGIKPYIINTIEINNWGFDREILLSPNKLAVFKFDSKTQINTIIFYDINNFNYKKNYTLQIKNIKYPLKTANIVQLNDNEILLAGGLKGKGLGISSPVQNSYILNIANYTIRRTDNMKNSNKVYFSYKINNRQVLFCEKHKPINNDNCEIFIR